MNAFIKKKTPFLIVCLLFILFNLLFFVLVPYDTAKVSIWLSYAFLVVAFLIVGCITLFLKLENKRNMTTLIPLFYATVFYFALTLVANVILMLVNSENATPDVVINAVILILFAITFLLAYKSFGRVADNSARQTARVQALRELSVKVNSLTFFTKDADVVNAIRKLKADVDDSSSAGTEASRTYEEQFAEQIETIRVLLTSGAEKDAVLAAVEAAGNLLKVRNQMLMIR